MPKAPSLFAKIFGKTADDAGRGSLDDYDYNLRPKKSGTVIRLAESGSCQEEIRRILELGADEVFTVISRRGIEEERTDAPMPVRLFVSGRMSGIVGIIPRGLEAPVDDALGRVGESGKPARIPAKILSTREGLRVDVLIGTTR